MHIVLKQTNKDFNIANFDILNENTISHVKVEGDNSNINISGNVLNHEFLLKNKKDIEQIVYNIIEKKSILGNIHKSNVKNRSIIKYDYYHLTYNAQEYSLYTYGLGEKIVYTLYQNKIQIAQIEKSCIITNDLHDFNIYAKEEKNLYISILYCLFIYGTIYYKPYEKSLQSTKKLFNHSINKELESKYNPNWLKDNNLE